jgi:hypothetical protein
MKTFCYYYCLLVQSLSQEDGWVYFNAKLIRT